MIMTINKGHEKAIIISLLKKYNSGIGFEPAVSILLKPSILDG